MPTQHEQQLTTTQQMIDAFKRQKTTQRALKRVSEELQEETEPED